MRYILIILLFTFCTPQKRLERLILKHPELIKKDSLIVRDTIVTENVLKDTLLSWHNLYDTVTIVKDNLRIKVVRKLDSIYIRGECLSDTIYTEKIVSVDKVVIKKPTFLENILSIWWLILIIVFVLFVYLRR